jgi:thiol:disulfide interchange protein
MDAPRLARQARYNRAVKSSAAGRGVAVTLAAVLLHAPAPAAPRVSATWYEGDQYDKAREEQDRTAAAMVLYVYTDWCPYCRSFEKGLLFTPEVERYFRDNVVKIRINPETTPAAAALARRLGAQGYPSFYLRMPGRPPERLALRAGGRLKSPAAFVAEIEARTRARRPN